jgi:hypothetical protein
MIVCHHLHTSPLSSPWRSGGQPRIGLWSRDGIIGGKLFYYFIFFNVTPTAVSSIQFGLVVYCLECILSIVLKESEKKEGVAYKGSLWLGMGKSKYFFFQQYPLNLFLCLALLVLVMGSIMLR